MPDQEIPEVQIRLKPTESGKAFLAVFVHACPYCGKRHTHGAGKDGTTLGHRIAHCDDPQTDNSKGYMIIPEKR